MRINMFYHNDFFNNFFKQLNFMNPQVNGAIKKLSKVATDLETNLGIINKYSYDKLTEVYEEIDTVKTNITNLVKDYKEKLREADVDLKLRMRENEFGVLTTLAGKHNKVILNSDEHLSLLDLVNNTKANEAKAIAIATSSLKKSLEAEHKSTNSTVEIELATLRSNLANKEKEIEFLNTQVEMLRKDVEAAGARIVSVAQASNQGAVTITK